MDNTSLPTTVWILPMLERENWVDRKISLFQQDYTKDFEFYQWRNVRTELSQPTRLDNTSFPRGLCKGVWILSKPEWELNRASLTEWIIRLSQQDYVNEFEFYQSWKGNILSGTCIDKDLRNKLMIFRTDNLYFKSECRSQRWDSLYC